MNLIHTALLLHNSLTLSIITHRKAYTALRNDCGGVVEYG